MANALDLSKIDNDMAWIFFDSMTGSSIMMKPLEKIDEEVSNLLLGELLSKTIEYVDSAYQLKGYVKNE